MPPEYHAFFMRSRGLAEPEFLKRPTIIPFPGPIKSAKAGGCRQGSCELYGGDRLEVNLLSRPRWSSPGTTQAKGITQMGLTPKTEQVRRRKGNIMSLITIIITLIAVGVLLWLANTYIPMDGKIKKILNIVVVVGVVLWLLNVFGVWGHLRDVRASIQPPFLTTGLVVSAAVPTRS
jgi:hypothetical protein